MGEGGVKASWGNLGLKSLGSSQLHGLTRIKNFMPNQRKCHTATILESCSERITNRLWELFMNRGKPAFCLPPMNKVQLLYWLF